MTISIQNRPRVGTIWMVLFCGMILSGPMLATDYLEEGDAQNGARTWAENCNRCHNARDPQDLRDDQWTTSVFHMRVRAGLTGKQTRDVLEYLQTANNWPVSLSTEVAQAGSGTARSGEEVYGRVCVACHGADGKGTVPGAPDFTDADGPMAQSDAILLEHIRDGFKSPKSPMAMPPRGGDPNLNQGEMEAVLEFMRKSFSD
ncbi:c-type cytochrome [Elongatibacter sediminis]